MQGTLKVKKKSLSDKGSFITQSKSQGGWNDQIGNINVMLLMDEGDSIQDQKHNVSRETEIVRRNQNKCQGSKTP